MMDLAIPNVQQVSKLVDVCIHDGGFSCMYVSSGGCLGDESFAP